ncbi:MAG: Holliday junction resolvase RuvX [Planctomycetes bacterium]|nr:Holliday junction resolvase RuvX [Planctomycetota bacterium]
MGGVLSIDYGDKKCGFASADALRIACEPLGVLRHEGDAETLLAHIERLLAERNVTTLVVGLPLHMDGRPGRRVEVVQTFVARLRARFPNLEVHEWDERLTTKEAESRLREAGRRGKGIKAERDAWSALVLLEDWLASH